MKSFLCLLLFSLPLCANDARLNLERIFEGREFSSKYFGPVRWLDDGKAYTTVEDSASVEDGRDIISYDTATGERTVLVPADKLILPGSETPLAIDDYEWSPKRDKMLLFTNSKRVWRYNTRGDYYVIDLTTWKAHKLGEGRPESSLMFAKFDPAAKRVAYVSEHNIYVEDLSDGKISQLTKDGSDSLINGTFDWVYEEEFFCRDGFRWSPDGKEIAYWQLDASGVGTFYLINNTEDIYAKLIPLQYPKAGTTNSSARVGVISADGGETHWINFEGDPRENYLPRMEWFPDSSGVLIQRLNRLQNHMQVFFGPRKGGDPEKLFEERDEAWIDVVDDVVFFDSGKAFTWVSERLGWRHIYLYNRDGSMQRSVTPENFDVISVISISEKSGWVYFMASPYNATQQYLYRARLDGKGQAERLTPEDSPGWHRYQISPDQQWAFHNYSRMDQPTVYDLVSLPDHQLARVMQANQELRDKVSALDKAEPEFFRVDIGEGVELDGWMLKPPHFDATKKYPVLFFVYGEPGSQTVIDRWAGSRYLWHLYLTQKGYLVVSIDNRGTPGPRGREWRKCIYKKVGQLNASDQAAAARKIKELDYVDENNVAIWGWSGGGSSSLNAIFKYADVYHTAMCVAPVPDQRYYDTIYQERYSGHPKTSPESYHDGSPINFADQLKGNLLLIHGTGDDNVHYQGTEALIDKLVEHGKQFTLMSYPNRNHGMFGGGKGTYMHLYTLMTQYLEDHHPPVAP